MHSRVSPQSYGLSRPQVPGSNPVDRDGLPGYYIGECAASDLERELELEKKEWRPAFLGLNPVASLPRKHVTTMTYFNYAPNSPKNLLGRTCISTSIVVNSFSFVYLEPFSSFVLFLRAQTRLVIFLSILSIQFRL